MPKSSLYSCKVDYKKAWTECQNIFATLADFQNASEFTKNMFETSNSCFQIHSKAAGYANYKSQMVTLNPLSHIQVSQELIEITQVGMMLEGMANGFSL